MLETNERIKRLEGMTEAYQIVLARNKARLEELDNLPDRKDKNYYDFAELLRVNDFLEREIKTNERIFEKLRSKKNGIDECTRSAEVESVRKGTHALL